MSFDDDMMEMKGMKIIASLRPFYHESEIEIITNFRIKKRNKEILDELEKKCEYLDENHPIKWVWLDDVKEALEK